MEEKNKPTLSVIIITKNEEKNIRDCIKSAYFADEIVVLDSESEDKTVEIARNMKAKVLVRSFHNFAEQRNFALNHVESEWVLYLDADERVSDTLQAEIRNGISNQNIDCFRIQRKNVFYKKFEWPDFEKMERLFRKKSLKEWRGKVHESPVLNSNNVQDLEGFLLHFTHNDLESMVAKTNKWSEIESQIILDAKHPRMREWRFIRIMITKFFDSYVGKSGWKAGTAGLLEALYQAYSYFVIYSKVWEKQGKK